MIGQGGKRKAEGGIYSCRSRCAPTSLHSPPSPLPSRHGVTLVELLITAAIVATLSATFLGVSNLAMESGRAARTKTTIAKLHGLLTEKWTEYETRRVDINPELIERLVLTITGGDAITATERRALGIARADLRLLALRELMKLEMPDRWSDITGQSVSNALPSQSGSFREPILLIARPAVTSTYLRRYTTLKNQTDVDVIQQNQGAECLYLTIMLNTGDGEARTLFSDQDIGDTDGDGAPEFLDGWGRPIQFIRWPAGFASAGRSDLMSGDADADHDPFDFFRRDQDGALGPAAGAYPIDPSYITRLRDNISGFRLVPLIYSTGPDGEGDLLIAPSIVLSGVPSSMDPYFDNYPGTNAGYFSFLGDLDDVNQDGDDNSLDNIHNHLQDNR